MSVTEAPAFNPNEHLMKLKGNDYLEVKWRLVWFRSEHPHGRVTTEVQECDPEGGYARVKARVEYDVFDGGGGQVLAAAESTGTDTAKDFADFLEKAETKAIGRALAALGYGTQFAEDHEMLNPDGTPHVVDAPIDRKKYSNGSNNGTTHPIDPSNSESLACESCGKEVQGSAKYTAEQRAGFIRRANGGKLICKACGGG